MLRVVLVAALLLLVGCKSGGGPRPADAFTMALASDPETFDPAVMSGSVEGSVAYQVFEGLYAPAVDDGPPVPGVAMSHTVSDDGRVWTFRLRTDARWSTGEPVTADDFVYAWMRILRKDIACDYISFLRYLKNGRAFEDGKAQASEVGVRAAGPHELVVELEEPIPYFLEVTKFYTLFPVHRGSIERHGQEGAFRAENLVGNGAYRMVSYGRRNRIVLEANPHYWDAANVAMKKVEMLIIEDGAAKVTAFLDQRADWVSDLPLNQLDALRALPDFRSGNLLGTYYFRFNVTKPPLNDPRVRRALSMALNREELCKCTLNELYRPASTFVPPLPGYEAPALVRYDPDGARKLLAEAGFPGGKGFPTLTILYNTSENHKTIAQAVQDAWQLELGITVELRNEEWKVYLETMERLDYLVARAGWIGDYADPNTFLEMWRGDDPNNNTGFANETYDSLIARAFRTIDPAERLRVLAEAETLLLTEAPVMPLYYYPQFHLVRTDLRGWEINLKDTHLIRYIRREGAP